VWRLSVAGHDKAIATLEQIAAIRANEVFMMHADTQEVIVRKLPLGILALSPAPG
jgi:hypothetical protein